MSSAGMLGVGVRGTVGVAVPGSSSISCFRQSSCSLFKDRDLALERVTKSSAGAVDCSEGWSCSFASYQGAQYPLGSSLGNDCTSVVGRCIGLQPLSSSGSGRASELSFSSSRAMNSLNPRLASMSTSSGGAAGRNRDSSAGNLLGLPDLPGKTFASLRSRRVLGSIFRRSFELPTQDRSKVGDRTRQWKRVNALGRGGEDGKNSLARSDFRESGDMQALKSEWNLSQFINNADVESDPNWEQMNMLFRVIYAIVMYGGLAVAGSVLANFIGVDCWGGFELSIKTFVQGVGYSVPPMMVLLFILEDEVVKNCPPARAIRDVEDEELMDFFVGMSPWQFLLVVAAGSLSEELFFRVAVQGGLAHALHSSGNGVDETTIGIAALTGVIPIYTPFSQLCAAVLTAALTGSMYYIISSPKDPTHVVAPSIRTSYGQKPYRDLKKQVAAWYERRQLKKIYSPLVESLLALYLGFEWVQSGNIFAPMITHTLYSLVVVGNGLRRINDNRQKLRQRVSRAAEQAGGGLN